MFIIVLGQHVSILIESSSGPSKNTDHYLAMFKMRCGIQNAYILDITMYNIYIYNITTGAFCTMYFIYIYIKHKDTCILYIVISRM